MSGASENTRAATTWPVWVTIINMLFSRAATGAAVSTRRGSSFAASISWREPAILAALGFVKGRRRACAKASRYLLGPVSGKTAGHFGFGDMVMLLLVFIGKSCGRV